MACKVMNKIIFTFLTVLMFVNLGATQYAPSSMVAGIIRSVVTNWNHLPAYNATNVLYNQDKFWCLRSTNIHPAGLYLYTRNTTSTGWTLLASENPIADKKWVTNLILKTKTNYLAADVIQSNASIANAKARDTIQSNIVYLRYIDYASTNFVNNKTNFGSKSLIASNAYFTGKLKVDGNTKLSGNVVITNTPLLTLYRDVEEETIINIKGFEGADTLIINSTGRLFSGHWPQYVEFDGYNARGKFSSVNTTFSNSDIKMKGGNITLDGVGVATTNFTKSKDTIQSNKARTDFLAGDTAQSNIVITRYLNYASTNFVNNKTNFGKINVSDYLKSEGKIIAEDDIVMTNSDDIRMKGGKIYFGENNYINESSGLNMHGSAISMTISNSGSFNQSLSSYNVGNYMDKQGTGFYSIADSGNLAAIFPFTNGFILFQNQFIKTNKQYHNYSTAWGGNWIALATNANQSHLNTIDKTILGAINEVNSKSNFNGLNITGNLTVVKITNEDGFDLNGGVAGIDILAGAGGINIESENIIIRGYVIGDNNLATTNYVSNKTNFNRLYINGNLNLKDNVPIYFDTARTKRLSWTNSKFEFNDLLKANCLEVNNTRINIGTNTYANTNNGIGIGRNAYNNYTYGVGIGENANYNYTYGVGIGRNANYNNNYGVGVGNNANNNYSAGVGVGYNAYNNYTYGVGIGWSSFNNYNHGVGIGYNSCRNYNYGVGIGKNANYNYNYGIGIGNNATNNYNYGIGIGQNCSGNSNYGIGIGNNASGNDNNSIGIGKNVHAYADNSIAIGQNLTNNISYSVLFSTNYDIYAGDINIHKVGVATTNYVNNKVLTYYTNNEAEYTNGSTTYKTNLRLQFTPETGSYEFGWSCELKAAGTTPVIDVQIVLNGVEYSFSTETSPAYKTHSGSFIIKNLSGSSIGAINFRQTDGTTPVAYIRRARLVARKIP